MKPSAILYGAAKELRRNGWVQWIAERNGKHCIIGAIRKVTGRDPFSRDLITELFPVRDIFASVVGCDIATFNNYDCESADDAIAALEIIADVCAAEGR